MAWQLVICAVRAWEAAEIVGCSPLRRTVGALLAARSMISS